MKSLTILVDLDDTIESLCEAWVNCLNNRFGMSVALSDITEWDMTKAFPALTKEAVYAPLCEDEFWDTVYPIAGAAEVLQKLIQDGHRIYLVTATDYKTIRAKMERVVLRHFPFLSWGNVIVTNCKQLIKGDVLIDDAPHNLEGGDYAKILMTAPHNRNYDTSSGDIYRATNWYEIYYLIRWSLCLHDQINT